VGQERDPLSLVCTLEEVGERQSRDSGLEIREYGRERTIQTERLLLVGEVSANFCG
jgi:hypothetical protein